MFYMLVSQCVEVNTISSTFFMIVYKNNSRSFPMIHTFALMIIHRKKPAIIYVFMNTFLSVWQKTKINFVD